MSDEPTDGYIFYTLNQTGVASTFIDACAEQFIKYASQQISPVLEVGAAFGAVTIAALKAGARVIANDIEPRHLQFVLDNTPGEYRAHLTLLPGAFPQVLEQLDHPLAGCFISRTLAHLTFSELRQGLRALCASLHPGAKIFIVVGTVYSCFFRHLIPIYEQRLLDKEEWPGYFTGLKSLFGAPYDAYLPDRLNFLDENTLSRELVRAGFIIEETAAYERKDLPPAKRFNDRESRSVIARKPQ